MRLRSPLLLALFAVVLVVVAGGFSACGSEPAESQPPASIEKAANGGPSKLTLTAQAVERLGIQTVAVQAAGQGLLRGA